VIIYKSQFRGLHLGPKMKFTSINPLSKKLKTFYIILPLQVATSDIGIMWSMHLALKG